MCVDKVKKKYLIFDAGDGAVVTLVKISLKILGRKYRSFISVDRKPKSALLLMKSEEVPPELRRRKVGELSNTVDRSRIEELMTLRAAQVRLKHLESVIVLLLSSVGFAELRLEQGEMVVGVQKRIIAVRHDLPDQRIILDNGDGLSVNSSGGDHKG